MKKRISNRNKIFGFLVTFTLLGVIALLVFHHNNQSKAVPISSYAQEQPNNTTQNTSATTQPSLTPKQKVGTVSLNLNSPYGTFVSNHNPNLSGSPASNQMDSICITVPDATCEIDFNNGTIKKLLGPKTADGSGTVHWQWKLQDIGLTAGTWKIEAIARINNQAKSTDDAMPLQVSP